MAKLGYMGSMQYSNNTPLADVVAINIEARVEEVCSLIAAAAPLGSELGTPDTILSNVLAVLYQDDDAHDTCSLTACLNPLHPGPCKGWKGTLFKSAPGAFHALEKAKADKANAARIKKISDLKAKGLPIPKKLLTPIQPKPHPHAGKTANSATGESHEAGKAVSEAAGVHVKEPGKVTLGQASKTLSVQKGPKGKKPTLASKGIAHVIAQEKVTPQYKLDKAAAITPEQWAGLSAEDKATIRGELAKIKKDGFGPQQKKASELLDKLADKNFVGAKDSHGVVSKAKPGGETTVAAGAGLPVGYLVTKDGMGWSLKYKGKLIRTSSTKEALVEYAHGHHAKNAPPSGKITLKEMIEPGATPPPSLTEAEKAAKAKAAAAKEAKDKAAAEVVAKAKAAGAPKVTQAFEADLPAADKLKPLPKHVQNAIDMANGHAPGASWSKNHLAAYQPLSGEEFQGLPKDVQGKIVAELTKGQSKFLDPKKVQASKDLLAKFGKPGQGQPKADIPKIENVSYAEHLHDHSVTPAQAKEAVTSTHISVHFKNAQQLVGLKAEDHPSSPSHSAGGYGKAKELVAQKTDHLSPSVKADPQVKAAATDLTVAKAKQGIAESVAKAKAASYNKISKKLTLDGDKLSPIEKASLKHYQNYLIDHQSPGLPGTKTADLDKLAADTKKAEDALDAAIKDATKKANAPSLSDMTPAQIKDRTKELLGDYAVNPQLSLSLAEMKHAQAQGEKEAKGLASEYPASVLADPAVDAKFKALASVLAQHNANAQEKKNLSDHLAHMHTDAILTGLGDGGVKLTPDDKKVIALHAIQLTKENEHITSVGPTLDAKLIDAKNAFQDAADKVAAKPVEPVTLSAYDEKAIPDAYGAAWNTQALKAVTFGSKTLTQQNKMKAHPSWPVLSGNLADLRDLSAKLALAHAKAHTASLNVPTDEDGAMAKGPEHTAWLNALADVNDMEDDFKILHSQAQKRLDAIRENAGLKKRALPKFDAPAVKAQAAESGYYKSGSWNGPNAHKPTAAKNYMLAKLGPKLGVVHQTPSEKKAAKLNEPPKPASSKAAPSTPSVPVDLGSDSSIADIKPSIKKQITSDFKAMPKGKYLADPAADIFDNLVNLAAAHGKAAPGGSLSVDQVLKSIDETHSKALGVSNSGMLHKKVTDWLATGEGKAYAQAHSTPDAKTVKLLSGEIDLPTGVTLEPGQKVQTLAGPGPFDESLKASAFKSHNAKEAQELQDAYMKENGIKWSPAQKSAIKAYTGSLYSSFNDYLRGDGTATQAIKQDTIHIQAAMMPLTEHTLLKRGTGWPPELASFQGDPQKLLGKTFEDKGFVSTTVAGAGGHFSGKALQLIIEAPKGTPAAFVNNISHFKDQENEMLLAAGTRFKVVSIEKTTGGHTVMRVRIVGGK